MVRTGHFENLNNHVVICNCNDKAGRIVDELQNGPPSITPDVVLIIQNRSLWESHPEWHPSNRSGKLFLTVDGYPTNVSVLHQAGIQRARAAIILADPKQKDLSDAPSALTAIAIEKQNPQVHTVMDLIHSVNRRHLEGTDVNEIVCLGDISEKLIAQTCITPGVKNIFDNLMTTEDNTPQIFLPRIPKSLIGKSYRELARLAILKEAPFILIGFIRNKKDTVSDRQTSLFVINPRKNDDPGRDTPLKPDDQLALIAYDRPDLKRYLHV